MYQVQASAIPVFERNQITGYEFEMGDITSRIIRKSTRRRCRIDGGWLIEKVGDLRSGSVVDKFSMVLNTLQLFEFVTALHCGRSTPVQRTLNVRQRRPSFPTWSSKATGANFVASVAF